MNPKHTPGPWQWEPGYGGLYSLSTKAEVMTFIEYEGVWLTEGPSQKANAALIAAAPELLNMLQRFLDALDEADSALVFANWCLDFKPEARATVRKATDPA